MLLVVETGSLVEFQVLLSDCGIEERVDGVVLLGLLELICHARKQVVLSVRADCGQVDLGLDPERAQDLGVANTGKLKDLRRLDSSIEPVGES